MKYLCNTFKKRILIFCALFGITACGAVNEELPTYEETSIVEVGDVAPDFSATLLNGDVVTLSTMRDEVVLLIFFSHTCPDCKALFNDLNASYEEFTDMGVRTIAIARDGDVEEVAQYVEDNSYKFDVAVDNNRKIYNLFATMYVPRAYLINQQGVVDFTTVEYAASHVPQLMERATALLSK